MSFDRAYEITSKHEGYYAFVAGDKGGETYRGISRYHHPNWIGWPLVDKYKAKHGPLKNNTYIPVPALDDMVKQFYLHNFWKHYNVDKIVSVHLANLVYDSCVLSGATGIRLLQEASNEISGYPALKVDGVMGNHTLGLINSQPAAQLHDTMKRLRIEYLQRRAQQPGQSKFWVGWLKRAESFTDMTKKSS